MITTAGDAGPLAVYIHVPFCGRRCAYCHFAVKIPHPQTDRESLYRGYVQHILREIEHAAALYGNRIVHSIFYGGGTPSNLPLPMLLEIQTALRDAFHLSGDCEISLEVNPEDADDELWRGLLDAGFTRISFGVQSFHDPSLRAVNRAHSGEPARCAIERAPAFRHGVSFDLMLGLPHQTEVTLETDLALVAELKPQHLAVYMLERDLPTPLDKTGRGMPMPNEDQQAGFYERVVRFMTELGYRHYEISNFARPGYECRHNLTYWHCGDYLGLGPAAHGRIGNHYRWNHDQLCDYQKQVSATGFGQKGEEQWNEERMRQERLVQGLRLDEGVPITWMNEAERQAMVTREQYGLVRYRNERVYLTQKGMLLGNEVFGIFA